MSMFPEDARVANTYAWCFVILEKPERARQAYRLTLERNPDNVTAILGMDNALQMMGKKKEALQLLEQAANKSEDVSLLAALGRAQIVNGRVGEEEATLKRCISVDPANSQAWLLLATSFCEQGRWSEAFEAAENAFVPGMAESTRF